MLIPIILGVIVKLFFKKQVTYAVQALPLVSVAGIVVIIAAVVSANKEQILQSGLLILAVVILHNGLGLLFGYLIAKWCKMDIPSRRAISIEVGMQNSGLGAALATAHFSPLAAVPSAIFSVWHNLSGSWLATYWSKEEMLKMKRKKLAPIKVLAFQMKDYPSSNSCSGSSSKFLIVTRNPTASLPSTIR